MASVRIRTVVNGQKDDGSTSSRSFIKFLVGFLQRQNLLTGIIIRVSQR